MPFLLSITAELNALILMHKPRSMWEKEFPALVHCLHWDFLFLFHVLLMRKLARIETSWGHCHQQGDSTVASPNHAEIPLKSPTWCYPAPISKSAIGNHIIISNIYPVLTRILFWRGEICKLEHLWLEIGFFPSLSTLQTPFFPITENTTSTEISREILIEVK